MANTSCTGLHNQPTFRTNSIGSSAVGSLFAAFLQLIAGVFPSDFFWHVYGVLRIHCHNKVPLAHHCH